MEYKRSTSSMTLDQSGKVGVGMVANPLPFLTPRPERRRLESRGVDWNSSKGDRDRGEVNVQVVLSCRFLDPKHNKGQYTTMQSTLLYMKFLGALIAVFAYGQTGTDKTYIMEGGMRNKDDAIRRAVRQICDTLKAQNADYSMKVTFLELYNEEIVDLLTIEDYTRSLEERQKKPISLMEDGKGCVFVRGLEEAVYSANDIYNILERGASKRRTTDMLLNKRSR
ncbi:hypothetical protein QVD17_14456 [Tagetes erecta]|uniref:Kinesin motor domain-containing protein n=1 Tax=Tagetes erecta TaxID=13708 RepID=A0AAD8L3B8_TARER|nr:hypothetical protein QVD17_14456 [Tagetes erecta]